MASNPTTLGAPAAGGSLPPLGRRRSNDLRGETLQKHRQFLKQFAQQQRSGTPTVPLPVRPPEKFTKEEAEAEAMYLALEYIRKRNEDMCAEETAGGASDIDEQGMLSITGSVVAKLMKMDLTDYALDSGPEGVLFDGEKLAMTVFSEVDKGIQTWKDTRAGRSQKPSMVYDVQTFAAQGRRPSMEDKHVSILDLNELLGLEGFPPQAFFAVYDGHGGIEAAEYARTHLHVFISRQESFKKDITKALMDGFLRADESFLAKAEREGITSGATCISTLIRGKELYVSWLGDSQAILCRDGKALQLSFPHKPDREDEKLRIENAGGIVVWYGAWRVNGVLSVARAIGDKHLKKYVIGEPDILEFGLQNSDEFLVLGCDGLWDVMDPQGVVDFVHQYLDNNDGDTKGSAEALVENALELGSTDNVSVIIVFLHKPPSSKPISVAPPAHAAGGAAAPSSEPACAAPAVDVEYKSSRRGSKADVDQSAQGAGGRRGSRTDTDATSGRWASQDDPSAALARVALQQGRRGSVPATDAVPIKPAPEKDDDEAKDEIEGVPL